MGIQVYILAGLRAYYHQTNYIFSTMKIVFAALVVCLAYVYATNDDDMNVSCWHCPYGFLPGEACLNDPEDFGHAQTCRFGFDNACESLIIDSANASLHYNRKCARKGVTTKWGCHEEEIEIQGEGTYPGRVCYCDPTKDGDLCNSDV